MKTHFSLKMLGFIVLLTLSLGTGCSDFDLSSEHGQSLSGMPRESTHISQSEALEIANKFLGKPLLSRCSEQEVDFQYVITTDETRSTYTFSDTIAYVINYPDNKGFAIIASDRRVNPILAFADEGVFTFDNEVSKVNFIDRISSYIEINKNNTPATDYPSIQEDCFIISPVPQTSLSQNKPFNKYVEIEHPGSPNGCVAVATALIMTHSKTNLKYHGTLYPFKSIIEALSSNRDVNTRPIYTYDQAVDSIAKIMYWIGQDIGMEYGSKQSSSNIDSAFNLLTRLEYNPTKIQTFKEETAFNYIKNKNMIYMRGVDKVKVKAHAWVCDGGLYCVDNRDRPTKIIARYFHCDWGWGGYCNGYFSGPVFSPLDTLNFTPLLFFAVTPTKDHGQIIAPPITFP